MKADSSPRASLELEGEVLSAMARVFAGPASAPQLAAATGRTQQTVRKVLDRLIADNRVEVRAEFWPIRFEATDHGCEWCDWWNTKPRER